MKHYIRAMFGLIHKVETDPLSQYRFNLFFTWVWFWAMVAVPFIAPHKDGKETIALVILEVSLWANFASHLGAIISAIPAIFMAGEEDQLQPRHLKGFMGFIKRTRPKPFANPNLRLGFGEDDLEDVSGEPYSLSHYEDLPGEPPLGHRG